MLINEISNIIKKDTEFKKIENKHVATLAVASSLRPLITSTFNKALVVVPGNAHSFAYELSMYLGKDKVLDYEKNKLKSIYEINNKIVVCSSRDLLTKVPKKISEYCKPIKLKTNEEYDHEKLIEDLVKIGYTRLEVLDGPGTFRAVGGTIDIYADFPIRLDFFGDELEEIKNLILSTGQAINQISEIDIFPHKDIVYSEKDIFRAKEKLESRARNNNEIKEILDHADENVDVLYPYMFDELVNISEFLNEDTLLIQSEPRAILDDMLHFEEEFEIKYFDKYDYITNPKKLNLGNSQKLYYVSILQKEQSIDAKLTVKRPKKHKNLEHLATILRSYIETDFYTLLNINNTQAKHDIKLELVDYGLSIDEGDKLKLGLVNIVSANLNKSFVLPDSRLAVISLDSLSSVTDYVDITKITFPYKPGDYVVHAFHGIARFKDLVKRSINDTTRDYLLLEYAEKDKLYVPIEQLGRVTKYVGPKSPRITRLGTADWSRAMNKARKATKKMAFDLVDVYSRRSIAKGHKFSEDTQAQLSMENDFPYTETPDQLLAIEQVKADMQSDKPMDRLICGDVGFGKTEVAIRAAFKCVEDNMQVMFLCPTTILAQQHFQTFYNRLNKYNINIEVLSRFKTKAQSKKIIDNFANGNLDILIGTHRLLSRDINPKNLGLIIVDEEQRFGVAHKEQLKNFRDSVDVLTLTATPIPRTMQMATSGVRDISLIMTPPDDRQAVKVHVGEWDSDIVTDAIRRELNRHGQVYYISNRINTIDDVANKIGLNVGEARIAVAHGRMKKDQLETIMEDFSARKYDVLVSTTIIESGIDNPNTNTLIIENAENLGLSQMYQLKGRVGRSVEQAYAYFLFNDDAMLNEASVKRLEAINEFDELGSGLQIAMRDLEIRGAGNFLGAEQSGNVSNVGFDLFAQMLKGAIENTQGDNKDDYLEPTISDISVNIPGKAYIPDDYIEDVDEKVLWYRKFASARSIEDVYNLESDLLEQHPNIPDDAQNLILKSRIAGLSVKHGFSVVSVSSGNLILEGRELDYKQARSLRAIGGKYIKNNLRIVFNIKTLFGTDTNNMFELIYSFLEELNF